jgi:hypothetical protein
MSLMLDRVRRESKMPPKKCPLTQKVPSDPKSAPNSKSVPRPKKRTVRNNSNKFDKDVENGLLESLGLLPGRKQMSQPPAIYS